MTGLTTTELALLIGFVAIVFAGMATLLFLRKRRSARLRSKFGGAEYTRAMKESGNRRHAEAALEERTERVTKVSTFGRSRRRIVRASVTPGAESRRGSWTAPPVR